MRYLNSRNRAILREMVSTDFKVRYQGSVLGYLWSLLKPLLFFAILYVVFTYIIPLGKGVEHFPIYLLLGVILWTFFVETTTLGASSVVARGDLIRKISIPRYLVVVSSSISALINLGFSMIVVIVFALISGIAPTLEWLLLLPLLLELYIFALGVSFLLAALYVKYRDITYIWEIFLQAGFYATPIVYPLMMVSSQYQKYFFLNPLTQIIQDARFVMVTPTSTVIWTTASSFYMLIVPFLIVIFFAVAGGMYFKRRSKYFAEDI